MIRLKERPDLTARERYGLDVLVDLSRLLVVLDPTADTVRINVVDGPDQGLDTTIRAGLRLAHAPAEVRISRILLGHVTDLAGAAVELSVAETDRHGRVPASANPLVRAQREREPVVQRWAAELRAAVLAAAERRPVRLLAPWPDGRRWAAALTHDLDVVSGWPAFTLLRVAELAAQGEGRRVGQVMKAALGALGSDPVGAGVRDLIAAERSAGVTSTWFVLTGTPTPARWLQGDVTYRLESTAAAKLLETIRQAGNEIGLHGSFQTLTDAAAFTAERGRLGRALGSPPVGVRQHFLRMRPGQTQAAMQQAGFGYDATFGYADRSGFRLGLADVVPAWLGDRAGQLSVVPLVWMDRALSKYGRVQDPSHWVADALQLAATCRATEGLWVGLWHPNLSPALGYPGAPGAFAELVRGLVQGSPYFATLQRITAWRRVRRTIRARRIAPDGGPELATGERSDWVIALEDEQGRAVGSPIRPSHDG